MRTLIASAEFRRHRGGEENVAVGHDPAPREEQIAAATLVGFTGRANVRSEVDPGVGTGDKPFGQCVAVPSVLLVEVTKEGKNVSRAIRYQAGIPASSRMRLAILLGIGIERGRFNPCALRVIVEPTPAVTKEIKSMIVAVAVCRPRLGAASDKKASVTDECMMSAKNVAVRRGHQNLVVIGGRRADDSVASDVIHTGLVESTSRLGLRPPMLVTTEENNLPSSTRRDQRCVYR